MINITSDAIWSINILDTIARDALGSAISGVSVGNDSVIHLLDDTPTNRATCVSVLAGGDSLSISTSASTLVEGDPDPVITCNDVAIAGDANVGYIVMLDGVEYAKGIDAVVSGVAELTLTSPLSGVYDVYVYRLQGDYVSNSVQITVSEV